MRTVRTKAAAHQPAAPCELATVTPLDERSMALSLIQALIPLGLQAVEAALQAEVTALAGARYAHADGHAGVARGLAARLDLSRRSEAADHRAARARRPRGHRDPARDVRAAADATRGRHGPVSPRARRAVLSRRFVGASAQALRQFHERRHDDATWLVLLLDGKSFASDQVVIALGVTTTGEKRVLGLVQTATENTRVCAEFLRELIARGFQAPQGLAGGPRWGEGLVRRRP